MEFRKNRFMFHIKIIAVRQHIDEICNGNIQHKPWEDFQTVHGFYFHIIGDDAVKRQQQCDQVVDEEAPADRVRDAVDAARVQEAEPRKQAEQCEHPEHFVIFGNQEDDAEYRVDAADLQRQWFAEVEIQNEVIWAVQKNLLEDADDQYHHSDFSSVFFHGIPFYEKRGTDNDQSNDENDVIQIE